MREIVFDTETTGLDPGSGDRMVEIGCIEIFNRIETGRTFHAYFNPEREMPFGAEAVHGLTTIFLSDKPLFSDKAEELLEFIGDAPLVAHNASFDFAFMNFELERCGLGHVPLLVLRSEECIRAAPCLRSHRRLLGPSTSRPSRPTTRRRSRRSANHDGTSHWSHG